MKPTLYTLKELVELGQIHKLHKSMCETLGFKASVYVTDAVYESCIRWDVIHPTVVTDSSARAWSLLTRLAEACRIAPDSPMSLFRLPDVVENWSLPVPKKHINLTARSQSGDEKSIVVSLRDETPFW